MKRLKSFDHNLLIVLVLPLFAFMPLLLHHGLPNTADGPIHLMRQVEFNQAWAEGNYYPRWGFDLAYGHGMPIFSYAPPLLYFLTQFFHLLGLPLDTAMKAVVILDLWLYGLGMYLFVRRIFGPYPALVAACVHIYAPYRLREIYIQGNYAQFTALACYPFILWAFHGLITTRQPRYLLAAALALAALLFSHNISAMLFAPLLAAYLLFLLFLTWLTPPLIPPKSGGNFYSLSQGERAGVRVLAHPFTLTVIAGLLGLGLAAIFWLPAFGERHDIKLEGITQDFFDFRENFISLSELLSPPRLLDRAAINPEFPLSLGLAQIMGAMLALLTLIVWLRESKSSDLSNKSKDLDSPLAHALFFMAALLGYAFLTIPPSQWLWERVPMLELTEFPWRMLGPALCCASIVAAIAPYYGLHYRPVRFLKPHRSNPNPPPNVGGNEGGRLVILGALFLPIILNLYYLYPAQFIVWGSPTPTQLFQYEITTGAIGTTSTGEFLPRTAQQHPQPQTLWPDYAANRSPQRFDPATIPNALVTRLNRQAESETWQIITSQPLTATLRLLHWPGWKLYLNEQATPFTVITPTGLIQTVIPAGQHTLTMQLESTPLRTWGKWLSLFSLLILTWRGYEWANKRDCHNSPIRNLAHSQPYFLLLTSYFLFLISYFLFLTLEPLFTLRSDPNSPQLADHHAQANFGDQLRLVGFDDLPSQTIKADDSLTVILYWRALQPLDTNYSIFVHLDTPNGQTYATIDEPDPEFIPTRNWPPTLFLRNILRLTIPPNLPPIRYTVTVGAYNRQNGTRLTLPNGESSYPIGQVWLTQPAPPRPAQPLAHFGPITLWDVKLSNEKLILLWQTDQPITQNNTIFIHLLNASGQTIAQTDGLPYQGLYPLTNWQPGQLIIDTRPLEPNVRPTQIAIGLYDPVTGQRLPATDMQGHPLPDNTYLFNVIK